MFPWFSKNSGIIDKPDFVPRATKYFSHVNNNHLDKMVEQALDHS